jgi:hypothetical protein
MPLAPLSRRRKANPSTVLGELVQPTTGKWITHPPSRCPNGHTLGPAKCWSDIKRASVMADTPHGPAGYAIRRCTGRRSTLAARCWRGQRQYASPPGERAPSKRHTLAQRRSSDGS